MKISVNNKVRDVYSSDIGIGTVIGVHGGGLVARVRWSDYNIVVPVTCLAKVIYKRASNLKLLRSRKRCKT